MTLFESKIDLIIFSLSCIILVVYLIKFLRKTDSRSDDEDGGNDGGLLNPSSDPVLDLPPGVTLPIDVTEPEVV